jgi:LPXTG-motif cell wall-anchored protein
MDVVFSPFDPDQDYHDIKTIIEVAPPKKKQWWWWAAGGAVLLAALIIYFVKRKKPAKKPVPVVSVNAYDEAMKQLEKLKNTRTDPKSWHSELTDIFRQYIFRRKGIFSLQKTTDDLVIQLKQLNLGKESLDNLAQSLRLSDFVKFAKYIPTEQDNSNAFEAVRNSIQLIERSDIKAE